LYDERVFGERLAGHSVLTSPLQRLGASQRTFKVLMPAMPWAAEHLNVANHELVVSSSSAFAHGVLPDHDAIHVCYCYTPFRYAWYERGAGLAQAPRIVRPLVARSLDRIRRWDKRAATRGTYYIAISRLSQERIARFWNVDAPIVYPPVEVDRFTQAEPEDFFLVVCELVRHKQVDVALEAARRARVPVKVVGSGADERRLRDLYGEHAEFLGRLDDVALAQLYPRSRALIIPNVEEFGITAVEAQAAGRPVIAAAAGGALETVIDGETGVLVPPGDIDALARALSDRSLDQLDVGRMMANAQSFGPERFAREIASHVQIAVCGQRKHTEPSLSPPRK